MNDSPSINISPPSGFSIPESNFIKVVFPTPFSPNKQNISPGKNIPEKLSSTFKSLYFFVKFFTIKLLFDVLLFSSSLFNFS